MILNFNSFLFRIRWTDTRGCSTFCKMIKYAYYFKIYFFIMSDALNKNSQNISGPLKYNGWLVSNSFIKRSVACFTYSVLGNLLVFIPIVIIGVILTFIVAAVK